MKGKVGSNMRMVFAELHLLPSLPSVHERKPVMCFVSVRLARPTDFNLI